MSERQEQESSGEGAGGSEAESPAAGEAQSPAGEEGGTSQGEGEGGEARSEGKAEAAPARRPGRGAFWLGLIAVLLALAAAGAGGYGYWRLERDLRGMEAEIAAQAERRAEARRELRQDLNGLGQELGSLQSSQEDLAGRSDRLDERLDAIQSSVRDLVARLEGGPSYWRLERIETLLLAADRVARLEGDAQAAYSALSSADTLLKELKDPGWLEVRRAVQSAMSALERTPEPDVAGIAFRLDSLMEAALELPVRTSHPGKLEPEAAAAPSDSQDGGDGLWARVSRGVAQFWTDVKGLVRLRRSGREMEPLLPPDQATFLRHNLVLSLQGARLAALRGKGDIYTRSLTEAGDWTERFFRDESEEVQAMLASLKELKDRRVSREVPDLAQPLRTFRQMRKERGD